MTRLSVRAAAMAAATCVAAWGLASHADAQMCATCPTPTVAFSPVVAAPVQVVAAPAQVVVAPRLGLFDRWRLRRWGVAAPATTVAVVPTTATTWSAGFAPVATPTTWTAGFAPVATPTTWTTSFAPVATPTTWTAGFAPVATPHLTAFAPLQRPVAQTAFMVAAPSTACSPCATTVLSPVEVAPVVAAPACSACQTAASTGFADQASYAAPSTGCTSCATGGDSSVIYSTPAGSASDPATPQPQITTPAPMGTAYPPLVPEPEVDNGSATGTSFEAPGLIGPGYNPTARTPTVDVHTAVYRRAAATTSVSAQRPASRVAVDTGEWTATGSR